MIGSEFSLLRCSWVTLTIVTPEPRTPRDMARRRQKTRLVPKSKPAIEYHESVFRPRLEALRKEIEAVPLTVLVWGPGESTATLFERRVDILNALRSRNINAEMSESLTTDGTEWSYQSQEYMQAIAADLIVILCASPGSIAELAAFSADEHLARKMVVFIDRRHDPSYVSQGPARDMSVFGQLHYYTAPDDFKSKKLVNIVLHTVRKHQIAAWRRSSQLD